MFSTCVFMWVDELVFVCMRVCVCVCVWCMCECTCVCFLCVCVCVCICECTCVCFLCECVCVYVCVVVASMWLCQCGCVLGPGPELFGLHQINILVKLKPFKMYDTPQMGWYAGLCVMCVHMCSSIGSACASVELTHEHCILTEWIWNNDLNNSF